MLRQKRLRRKLMQTKRKLLRKATMARMTMHMSPKRPRKSLSQEPRSQMEISLRKVAIKNRPSQRLPQANVKDNRASRKVELEPAWKNL